MFSPTAPFAGDVSVSRLDSALRRIVALLPWYDPVVVEARHVRTEAVRLHSIDARQTAESVLNSRDEALRGSFGRMGRRLSPR